MGLRVIRILLSLSASTCEPWTCRHPYRKLQRFHRRDRGHGHRHPDVLRRHPGRHLGRHRIRDERLRLHRHHRNLGEGHHLDAERLQLGEARRGDQTNREHPERRQIRDEVTLDEEYCLGSGACPCPATTRTGYCPDAVHRWGECPCPATKRTGYCPDARRACRHLLLKPRWLPESSALPPAHPEEVHWTARRQR